MNQQPERRYSYTGGLVDDALRERWWPFQELRKEFNSFKPESIEQFEQDREWLFENIARDDPQLSGEEVLEQVDAAIRRNANPSYQREMAFHGRVMPHYVTVALLSHSLCEAVINAVLADGLAKQKTPDLFPVLVRAEFKDKWYTAPKAFHKEYVFQKGTPLSETLNRLNTHRNAFVHYKSWVKIDGVEAGKFTEFQRGTAKSHLEWMHRYFSLPFDLIEMIRAQIPDVWAGHFSRTPMSPAPVHWAGPPLKGTNIKGRRRQKVDGQG